jgi:hypothetical protein
VGDWVNHLARDSLTERRRVVKRVESRELPKDGTTTEQFFTQSSNEELLTVVERPGPLDLDEDSTQAVTTGRARRVSENSRLLVPLFLGLAVVLGFIVALIMQNEPRLDEQANQIQNPTSRTDSTSGPAPKGLPTGAAPQDVANAKTETGKSDPSNNDLDTDSVDRADDDSQDRTSFSQSDAEPPPCPKFIVDSEGIRRINRKCWK